MNEEFYAKLDEVLIKDNRYKKDAYEFLMQALWFTQKKLKREGHVTAKELLEGVREYGLDLYGPMVCAVFEHWGVKETADFGEMVFNMVDTQLMGKNENDSREDFKSVYDFKAAFDIYHLQK